MTSSLVTCRGITLLGLSHQGDSHVYVSVHQLFVKLFQRYGTPRPTLQKKMQDLGIKMKQCTKEQLAVLRKSEVVRGFRVSVISLEEAKIVCDALEQSSREKSGLEKEHTAKSRTRRLERQEKEQEGQHNEAVTSKLPPQPPFRRRGVSKEGGAVDGCVPFRNAQTSSPPVASSSSFVVAKAEEAPTSDRIAGGGVLDDLCLDFLLVAEPPSRLAGRGCLKHQVLQVFNEFTRGSNQEETDCSCMAVEDRLGTLRSHNHHHHPLSRHVALAPSSSNISPLVEGKSSNLSHPPTHLNSTVERGAQHSKNKLAKGCSMLKGLLRSQEPTGQPPARHLNNRKVHPTKLRLFAQTTSPSAAASPGKHLPLGSTAAPKTISTATTTRRSPQLASPSLSLVVTVSRSKLNSVLNSRLSRNASRHLCIQQFTAKRRGRPPKNRSKAMMLLSSHATKKQAIPISANPPSLTRFLRHDPSRCKNGMVATSLPPELRHHKLAPPPPVEPSVLSRSEQLTAKSLSQESFSVAKKLAGLRERVVDGPNTAAHELSSTATAVEGPALNTAVSGSCSCSNNSIRNSCSGVCAPPPLSRSLMLMEDDQASMSSSSSMSVNESNNSGFVRASARLTAPPPRQGNNPISSRLKRVQQDTISFDKLFSYYPPKLTVRDGELCPETSLSLNGLERSKLSSLPESHPFWNWTLGQPTSQKANGSTTSSKVHSRKHHFRHTKTSTKLSC